ncbi:TorF family putative porin [Phenylobacterium sp.]|uniref:TorF family putative porin n=1 Tax=Phenylobacterium sp. TaxID=1871053 RepID=UPI002811AEC4|nr:TorF family putative porin [Phenylobacterium sp.]
MNKLKVSLLAAAGTLAFSGVAHAQDEGPVSLSFNVGAATEYVFRGVSQTDEDPQVFGGVDATLGSIGYAGVWASNVDFGDSTDFEYDLYAGVRPTLGAVSLDLGVIYYGYADQPSGANWDYWEGKVAASVPAGPATLGAAVYYSPEFTGDTGDAWYYEVNATYPIPQTKFSISGALGHQTIADAGDYTTWNLGVGFALTDKVGIDVRYWDTDAHEFGKLYDSRVVAGLKLAF